MRGPTLASSPARSCGGYSPKLQAQNMCLPEEHAIIVIVVIVILTVVINRNYHVPCHHRYLLLTFFL